MADTEEIRIKDHDSQAIGAGVPVYFIVACVIAAVVYFGYEIVFRKTKGVAARGATFIIAGPPGAGKTSLYSLLRYGKKANTLPSIEANVTTQFRLPNLPESAKPFVLIDTPGHRKLRHDMFNTLETSQTARMLQGVIFVVDASAMSRPDSLREATEYLYDILRISERRRGGSDLLIAANKSELFTAVPAKRLRQLFQTELDKIRESKAASIGKVDLDADKDFDDEAESAIIGGSGWLGKGEKGTFRFEDLESEVTVLDGSVDTGKIESWIGWMQERALNN